MSQTLSCTSETLPGQIVHIHISPVKVTSSAKKAFKESKTKEIISAICALLNSDGGKLVMHVREDSAQEWFVTDSIRKIEQCLVEIVGCSTMVSNISLEKSDQKIVFSVKKSSFLITVNYNLYLPSQTQVISIPSTEAIENVKGVILNKRETVNVVKIGSHMKKFVKDQNSGLHVAKDVQFKHLKAAPSKCVTLGDRPIGKSNKFACYVSAFANHCGGHIYYGIRDDGTIKGEVITDQRKVDEIIKKVEKTINKMSWPHSLGKPQKGKQWDIFFEPVLDTTSNVLPSIYVIVIYVASCPGGVFTEEPESYEIVDGKVGKLKLSDWKMKLFYPSLTVSSHEHEVPGVVRRCSWSSGRYQKICYHVNGILMTDINNGNWENFERHKRMLERRFPESDARLVLLSKQVTAYYRKGSFSKADLALQEYNQIWPTSQNVLIFEVIGLYLQAALERCLGNFKTSYEILKDTLFKADQIPVGLITASLYSLMATLRGILDCQAQDSNEKIPLSANEKSEILSTKALEHLKKVRESPEIRTDMEQKSHINLAMLHLGCSLSGDIARKHVDKECLAAANSNLQVVSRCIFDGYPLSLLRELQFHFALSILYHRRSQIERHEKRHLLQAAFHYSKKANDLSRKCKFEEMTRYTQKCMALRTEDLVCSHFVKNKRDTDKRPISESSGTDSLLPETKEISIQNSQDNLEDNNSTACW